MERNGLVPCNMRYIHVSIACSSLSTLHSFIYFSPHDYFNFNDIAGIFIIYKDKTGKLMMLPSDLSLVNDPQFKPIVEVYAKNSDLFFSDFAYAFSKLLELGVDF